MGQEFQNINNKLRKTKAERKNQRNERNINDFEKSKVL